MAVVVCPRCNAPNDSRADAAGRLSCVICNHQWVPSAIAAAAPSPSPAPVPAARRSRPAATVSQEYLPDDPASEAPKALTTRQTADNGIPQARIASRSRDGAAELKPHSDRSHGGVIPPLKALPAKDPTPPQAQPPVGRHPLVQGTPRVTPATPTVEVDMDLFDRLEKEAQVHRSKQQTVAEITFAPPDAAAPAGAAGGQTLACPVCGHSFVATSTARAQTCPQCHTTFDHASGRFATLEGENGDPLIGRNLRGCVIDRKLGEGGMGSVYHARQLSLERSVAIKVLPPDLARNRNFIQRFEREAKSLAKINHPNILHIYDFGEEASLKLYFMIIEFVDGTDLGELLNRRTTLPQLEVLDLLRQAAMGLEMAAAKGVIHRDIKPDNLMIASDGTCKVSDFGLAKGYGDENEVTSVGVRVGTPAFMSPEQCDGIEVDWRSDVYNLGCTAFLCLTGRLPFDGETPFSIMLKHKNDPIPSVRDVSPSVEPAVDRLIKQLLAKKPADRCDSWRSLVDEIESIEVQLAGDPNIMRKSRSQLQALSKPVAPMPAAPRAPERLPTPPPLRTSSSSAARVPEGAPAARAAAAQAPAVPGAPLPEWLRPVDVPPAVATATPAVAVSPVPASRKSSEMRAPVVGQRPSPTASDPRAERASKRLNAELASAKDRGLRTEVEALVASAERLEAAGRFDEAAKELRKAAERIPDGDEAQALRQRAKEARRRGRWRRLARRAISLVVVLGGLFLALWLGTPAVHNLLADRALRDILAEDSPSRRAASLSSYIASTKPWPWYVAIFPKGYVLTPLAEAQHELDQINPKTPMQVQPQENPAVHTLEAAVGDPAITWPDILDQAALLMRTANGKDRIRVQAVLDQAQGAVATMASELRRIDASAANGQARDALAAAATFRTMHPRAGRLAQGLPLPGRVAARTEDGTTITVSLRVDGQPLPPGTNLFVRRADRDEILEIAARGFASVRQTVPADPASDEHVVSVTMQVAPVWTMALGRGLGGPAVLHAAADGLYVQRQEGVALLASTNGQQLAALEPLAGMQGPSYTGLWINDQTQNRVLVASTDGAVRSLDPRSLACVEVLHKGPAPVLAWLDIPLTYQAGMRARYLIEESRGNRRFAALKGDQEWWSYQALRGNLVPQLLHVGDQVLVIDDTTVHFLEEDGSNVQPRDLPSPRTGPVQPLAQDNGLLMPTAAGVQWVRFGKHDQPLVSVDDKTLLAVGPGQMVLDGRLLVVAHADSVEALQLESDHFTARWRTALDSPPVAVAAGEGVVAVANIKNRLQLYASGSGERLLTISLVNRPAGPPLIRAGLVIVADTEGVVSAYALPRSHEP